MATFRLFPLISKIVIPVTCDPKYIRPDPKGLAVVHAGNAEYAVIANNNDSLQAIKLPGNRKSIMRTPGDAYAIFSLKNKRSYRQEFYLGDNYLSSGSGRIYFGSQVTGITIFDIKGNKRNVAIQ